MNRRGSVLVVMMFLTAATLILARLVADMASAWIGTQKAQTASDFALLSAMRVRGQSLETVASRWDAFGSPLSVTGGTLEAPAALVPDIAASALALKRALPGYQGRITSALTVAAEANGADRTMVTQTAPAGLRLGLVAETALLSAPGLPVLAVEGLWEKRTWTNAAAADNGAIAVGWRAPHLGGTWEFSAPASAHVAWDADTRDATVAADGNGGFAADWVSASAGVMFRPNRHPVYRAASGPVAVP